MATAILTLIDVANLLGEDLGALSVDSFNCMSERLGVPVYVGPIEMSEVDGAKIFLPPVEGPVLFATGSKVTSCQPLEKPFFSGAA